MDSVKEKISKLERMAETSGPEAENARRLITKLLNKYQIHPSEMHKPRVMRKYKLHRLKKYGLHLACWMGVPVYLIRGAPDFIQINVDEDEYLMFHELMGEIKHQFNKHERKFLSEIANNHMLATCSSQVKLRYKNDKLKSFMKGYMDTNYPYDSQLCRKCKKGRLKWHPSINAYRCNNCGERYTSSKYRSFSRNQEAFMMGVNTTTKAIKQHRERIGYNG